MRTAACTLAAAALVGWAYLEWGEAGGRVVRRQQRRFRAWQSRPKPGQWWMRSRAGW
jgi:hypothetical protein